MDAQDVYLSPRQIVSYLMEFENKLVEPHKDYYKPQLRTTPISERDLNEEAKRMMDFVGLTNYTPKCSFKVLDEGVGGNTLCCNPNIDVEINVSTNYRNNVAATLAILAHEICHKYLYVNGLYNPITIINEIFTDLCTMYVGFGELIIKGYITERQERSQTGNTIYTTTHTSYLGYLKFPIYQRTLSIIRLVLWGENKNDLVKSESDPFLQDTFKIWIAESDKKKLSREGLIKIGAGRAELERNRFLAERLLRFISGRESEKLGKAEAQLHNEAWFDADGQIKLKSRFFVFNSIYQSVIINSESKSSEGVKRANRVLRHLIIQLLDVFGTHNTELLKINDFVCPFCGEHHKSDKFTDKSALIKCPKCKKRFYLDCTRFDLMMSKNDFDHYKDELIFPVRKGYMESLEREKKDSYNKGFSNGASQKEKEFRNKIAKLPGWIKWLIGKRLD